MRRWFSYGLLGVVWLALTIVLVNLTYEAAPWFDENIPDAWVDHYLAWYGAKDAESAADAEFLLMFVLCLLVTGTVLAVPFAVARLTSRAPASTSTK